MYCKLINEEGTIKFVIKELVESRKLEFPEDSHPHKMEQPREQWVGSAAVLQFVLLPQQQQVQLPSLEQDSHFALDEQIQK